MKLGDRRSKTPLTIRAARMGMRYPRNVAIMPLSLLAIQLATSFPKKRIEKRVSAVMIKNSVVPKPYPRRSVRDSLILVSI